MNPAPAISVRAMSPLGGSAATMAAASSRGLRPADFARRSATLLAKSPCCASRVRSTVTLAAGGICGSAPPASRASAVSSNCSISCFTRWQSRWRGGLEESTSEQLERIDVERPAQCAGSRQLLDLRQPAVEEAVQPAALAALDEQLRVIAAGALVDGRGHRSQQPHAGGRPRAERARLAQESQCRGGAACGSAQRGEAAERRPRGGLALAERDAGERVVAAGEQVGEQRMLGKLGLNQHLAGLRAAAGAAGDLHDGLREAVGGAKVT